MIRNSRPLSASLIAVVHGSLRHVSGDKTGPFFPSFRHFGNSQLGQLPVVSQVTSAYVEVGCLEESCS